MCRNMTCKIPYLSKLWSKEQRALSYPSFAAGAVCEFLDMHQQMELLCDGQGTSSPGRALVQRCASRGQ